jgi:hypothetical protein
MQDPLLHVWPGPHAFPQPPQFFGSTSTSTHTLPHSLCSGPQAQSPLMQMNPGPHAFPHPPQLLGSTVVSVHAPAQTV